MVEEFVRKYVSLIVTNTDKIEVSQNKLDENYFEIVVKVEEKDIGKVIGKNGNMINALRTILNGCKAKDKNSYKIQVLSIDG